MALVKITPIEARIRWDRAEARPKAVRWKGTQMNVVATTSVRDERAAYPANRGPRVTYLLQTDDGGHASVVFDGRQRRWYVEAIDSAA